MNNNDSSDEVNKVDQLEKKKTQVLSRLKRDIHKVRVNSEQQIVQPKKMLEFNGEPLINQNTLTLIKGQTGVHKSRLAEIIASILIADDVDKRSAIGFTAITNKPTYVLYVDTERDLDTQFPSAVQSIRKLAGYAPTERIVFLEPITLISISRIERLFALELAISTMRQTIPLSEHLVVILDVSTDTIRDFNDIGETYKLVDIMNRYMTGKNVSFIGLIHENPNTIHSTKARGHIGTELQNKASTVLRISKGKHDQYNLSVEKSRSSRVPKSIWVEYNDLLETLILVPPKEEDYDQETSKIIKYFTERSETDIARKDLVNGLGISQSTLDRRLTELIDNEIEIEKDDVRYHICSRKIGKEKHYYLKPIENAEDEI